MSVKSTSPRFLSEKLQNYADPSNECESYQSLVSNETGKLSFTFDMAKQAYGKRVYLFDLEHSCDADFESPAHKKFVHVVEGGDDELDTELGTGPFLPKISHSIGKEDETKSYTSVTNANSVFKSASRDEFASVGEKQVPVEVTKPQYKGILKKYIQYCFLH